MVARMASRHSWAVAGVESPGPKAEQSRSVSPAFRLKTLTPGCVQQPAAETRNRSRNMPLRRGEGGLK